MKQTFKQLAFILLSVFCSLVPVLSFAALDNPNSGVLICGGGDNEKRAIDNLTLPANTPPSTGDSRFWKADHTFDSAAYDNAYNTYLRGQNDDQRKKQIAEQQEKAWANYEDNSCQFIDIFRQIVKVINYLIAAAGIVFVVKVVMAGFNLVVFSSDPKSMGTARQDLTNAVIGFVIVMSSFALVNIIFQLLAIKLNASYPLNPFK